MEQGQVARVCALHQSTLRRVLKGGGLDAADGERNFLGNRGLRNHELGLAGGVVVSIHGMGEVRAWSLGMPGIE